MFEYAHIDRLQTLRTAAIKLDFRLVMPMIEANHLFVITQMIVH